MNIRIENWNGHEIRFVERITGDWCGVAADVCKALDIKLVTRALSGLKKDGIHNMKVIDNLGREQKVNVINEKNIYRLIFKSRKKEAESFQDWVFEVIRLLRQATGLEGFQTFLMLDKNHQKETMSKLSNNLIQPARIDFIKANTIANKAVSSMYGMPKMLKKDHMSPDMLVKRQQVLEDTVNLMAVVDKFGIDVSVSETIYSKYV